MERRTRWRRANRCPCRADHETHAEASAADLATSRSSNPRRRTRRRRSFAPRSAVEPREGRLYVFLPPVDPTEDYVELIAAIEDTAAQLKMPVLIEGYTPPSDPRLQTGQGHARPGRDRSEYPARRPTGRELAENTTALYEEARLTRLGTEKFMLDGRHTGTGGGNHLVLGGPTPADSPFLRRPDLLRSLLGYWLNHPSLSYLFSGVFIGPTSQAPRVDETRPDAIYELEIAFSLLERDAERMPAVAGRSTLPQSAGRCHRQHASRRVLHRQAVLARYLDRPAGTARTARVRNAAARAHEPGAAAAGAGIRRMVLEEAVRREHPSAGARACTIVSCCRIRRAGFRPRHRGTAAMPVIRSRPSGSRRISNFASRSTAASATTASRSSCARPSSPGTCSAKNPAAARLRATSIRRSSVCRFASRGLIDERYCVTCNGRRLPLQSTGTQGDFVCGVRYRAWQPPRCLHPTIPVHTPLVFDLVDLAAGRSIGGCTYHVAHPGGRNYDTFAVNSNEAEARRRARFFAFGHTPGPMHAPPTEENPEFPVDVGSSPKPRKIIDMWKIIDNRLNEKLAQERPSEATVSTLGNPRHGPAIRAGRRPLGRSAARHPVSRAATGGNLSVALGRMGFRQLSTPLADRPAAHSGQRHHVQRLRRSAGQGTSLADGSDSAADWRGRVGRRSSVRSFSARRC